MSPFHIFQMFCCAKTRQTLQQWHHSQPTVQKNKFLSYMWSSFQASFPQSFEEKHLFNDFLFLWEIHTSDQSLKALTVSQLCLLDRNQLYIPKWPASYSSEIHLALSPVATLPQLSWGIHCLEALAFSDVRPDESGKRHEEVYPGVEYHTDHAHLDKGLVFDAFSS